MIGDINSEDDQIKVDMYCKLMKKLASKCVFPTVSDIEKPIFILLLVIYGRHYCSYNINNYMHKRCTRLSVSSNLLTPSECIINMRTKVWNHSSYAILNHLLILQPDQLLFLVFIQKHRFRGDKKIKYKIWWSQ